MTDCHNMEMAWYKHFINISLQRNFHSSDSGSLVIDCLARWGGHFPQKANVQCKSIHTFSGRKCWMFMLKDWVSYFGYKMSLDFFQQWSPRPSTTATAFVGCHWRFTELQTKVPLPLIYMVQRVKTLWIPGLTATALLVAGGKVALGALQVSMQNCRISIDLL